MKLKIKKRHNKWIEITENERFLSVKGLVIEAVSGERDDSLKVILTYSNGDVKSLNKVDDEISLDMEFGGGYKLQTIEVQLHQAPGAALFYHDKLLGRIRKFSYEINTNTTIGKMFLEITLT